ncbi:MAG TPA: transposase [Thermoanaerobaculia bacterium]|nr:transposase [Thermoanaerobaculia bacterium]
MARPLRIEYPNALHHVTSRGNEQRDIFRTDKDRETFLRFLEKAVKRFGWSLSAWVLMSNHFHLVIQTPKPNLSRGMQWLNGKYAAWFNKTHHRSGHLFQGRFHGVLVEKEFYFERLIRYVVLNPVRANMVQRPEDYRWSSYRATAGLEKTPDWLDVEAVLASFGADDTERRASFQAFVQAALTSEDCLWDEMTNGIYLGTESWTRSMRAIVESKPRSTDTPAVQRAVGRPKMAAVVNAVARVAKVSPEVLRSRDGGALRRLAAWLGWNEGLLTLRSIAAGLRLRSEGYISNIIRRFERELCDGGGLLAQLDAATVALRA